MPFPFTMRHYQVFGGTTLKMKNRELLSPESWNMLRQEHSFFSISADRQEWLAASEIAVQKDGQDDTLKLRAHDVVSFLRDKGIQKIFSVGSGGAALEYQIKKLMPEVSLACSDYSPITVKTLKQVFIESDAVLQFDMLGDDWQTVREKYIGDRGVCLIYRIDAGLSDTEWRDIFAAMARAGIGNVLVIPTGTLTVLSVYNRKKRECIWMLQRVPTVLCGYVRTKAQFKRHWASGYRDYEYTFGGLKGFYLVKKPDVRHNGI